jgi:hypothetical protein
MKAKELLKIAAIAAITTGFVAGCATDTTEPTTAVTEEECLGATAEVKNAIYAAKLKNARTRNLGLEWRETAKLIQTAEKAAEDCNNARALILANKAEDEAAEAIAAFHASQVEEAPAPAPTADTGDADMGSYLVIEGDNLWNIAAKDSIYGNPYQWPLIYKANSGQIRDADLIYAGQFFSIPKASMAEADAAIQHAKTRGAWTLGKTEASDLDYLAQ